MAALVEIVLSLVSLALLIPALTLFVECVAALAPERSCGYPKAISRPKLAVLVPAHNEEGSIRAAIESLNPQLSKEDRLVVVAHACSDATGAIAREAGATVTELSDERTGKGYAVEHGLTFLKDDPPEVVVFMDADCIAHDGAIDALARSAASLERPVQGSYILEPRSQPSPLDSISAFACLVKNVVRPVGLSRLGLPCPLMGSGMAISWSVAQTAPIVCDHLVEDLQLGLDFALAGNPPAYCRDAIVTSTLPSQGIAKATQRRRWEHGHLTTLWSQGPRLLVTAIRRLRFDLLSVALDLCVPPVALLVLLVMATAGLSLLAGLLWGSWLPVWISCVAAGLVATSVAAAWAGFGRQTIPARVLLSAPFYALLKVPMYIGFLHRRQKNWVQTVRDAGTGQVADDPSQPS